MADQDGSPLAGEASTPNDLSNEIGASLASVWARYAGSRPKSAETALEGNSVHWTLAGGAGEIEKGLAAAESDETGPTRTQRGYRRELKAALERVTHRHVNAVISKADAETGVASEVFILEPRHRSN
jgi:uncharacterized protein YbcI